jgi:hypothetical protein
MGLAERLPPTGFVRFGLSPGNASPGLLLPNADDGRGGRPFGVEAEPGAGMSVGPDPEPSRTRGVPGVPGGRIPGVPGTNLPPGVPGPGGREGTNGLRADVERLKGGRGGAMGSEGVPGARSYGATRAGEGRPGTMTPDDD